MDAISALRTRVQIQESATAATRQRLSIEEAELKVWREALSVVCSAASVTEHARDPTDDALPVAGASDAKKGLKGVSCRFGTIFGASPGMRFHTAVNKFCWQAVMGQPITVWSTAYDQKRPYLEVCPR